MPATMLIAGITLAKKRGRVSGRHGYAVYEVPDFATFLLAEVIIWPSH
jgi:hypothetical protein